MYKIPIHAGQNFNDLRENGIYPANFWIGSGGNSLPPYTVNGDKMGILIVLSNSDKSCTSQLYLGYGGLLCYRGFNTSIWSDWSIK